MVHSLPHLVTLLVLVHFFCDYILQNDFIAIGKQMIGDKEGKRDHFGVPWYYPMSAHCAGHAMAVLLITSSVYLSIGQFIVHFIVDVVKAKGWINIHTDQGIHIVVKVTTAFLAFYYTIF